jgi:hypothetical protein
VQKVVGRLLHLYVLSSRNIYEANILLFVARKEKQVVRLHMPAQYVVNITKVLNTIIH